MSRYVKNVGNLEFAWGFDRPLSFYFFECYDTTVSDDESGYCLFNISSHNTFVPHSTSPRKKDYSNSEIMELMELEERMLNQRFIPDEHKKAIGSDLPF